ncbi:hypothetical protein F5Y09DRAFT_354299 [Xylaria sp. FL1042]|nr:hypothetical protein F5Y09DRAFT_354299 [Xylaria sp. FL1042]
MGKWTRRRIGRSRSSAYWSTRDSNPAESSKRSNSCRANVVILSHSLFWICDGDSLKPIVEPEFRSTEERHHVFPPSSHHSFARNPFFSGALHNHHHGTLDWASPPRPHLRQEHPVCGVQQRVRERPYLDARPEAQRETKRAVLGSQTKP